MKTEVKPTIAWLWDRFQKLGNYIETEKFLQSWGTKGSDGLSHDGRNHSSDEGELQSLRQQLVERCASVSDREGCYTEFVIRGNTLKSVIYLPNNSRFSGSRKDDANSAREMGCAYLFWAWELEQREKEASGD